MFELHILTIGQFSRNKFWGELDSQSYRDAICSSALIKGELKIITDPSLPPDEMSKVLFNRTGLRPESIDFVFLTHGHGDHYVGIELFEKARWLTGKTELEAMKNSRDKRTRELTGKLEPCGNSPAEGCTIPGVEFIGLPGHTYGITGMFFDTVDGRACVCGDAAMTRDFFNHREGYRNSVDFAMASESIKKMASLADLVVPGHDNYFINKREKPE